MAVPTTRNSASLGGLRKRIPRRCFGLNKTTIESIALKLYHAQNENEKLYPGGALEMVLSLVPSAYQVNGMFTPFVRSFQLEDLILFVWVAIIEPLLARALAQVLGDLTPWTLGSIHNPLVGLIFLAAGIGGAIVVATRAPGQIDPERSGNSVVAYARLPMLVTLSYMFLYGTSAFGIFDNGDNGLLLVVCAPIALFAVSWMLFDRLPQVDIVIRRILIAPMILLGTWNFSGLVHGIFGGTDWREFLGTQGIQILQNPNGALAFVTGLVTASVVLFYLIFIFAPRQIAFPNGSARDWFVRFGLFVVGLVFNIGFLQF